MLAAGDDLLLDRSTLEGKPTRRERKTKFCLILLPEDMSNIENSLTLLGIVCERLWHFYPALDKLVRRKNSYVHINSKTQDLIVSAVIKLFYCPDISRVGLHAIFVYTVFLCKTLSIYHFLSRRFIHPDLSSAFGPACAHAPVSVPIVSFLFFFFTAGYAELTCCRVTSICPINNGKHRVTEPDFYFINPGKTWIRWDAAVQFSIWKCHL